MGERRAVLQLCVEDDRLDWVSASTGGKRKTFSPTEVDQLGDHLVSTLGSVTAHRVADAVFLFAKRLED